MSFILEKYLSHYHFNYFLYPWHSCTPGYLIVYLLAHSTDFHTMVEYVTSATLYFKYNLMIFVFLTGDICSWTNSSCMVLSSFNNIMIFFLLIIFPCPWKAASHRSTSWLLLLFPEEYITVQLHDEIGCREFVFLRLNCEAKCPHSSPSSIVAALGHH